LSESAPNPRLHSFPGVESLTGISYGLSTIRILRVLTGRFHHKIHREEKQFVDVGITKGRDEVSPKVSRIAEKLDQVIKRETLALGRKPWVLDCGAGNCDILGSIETECNRIGVDIHSHHHEKSTYLSDFINMNDAHFTYGDATRMPFLTECFDIVFSNEFMSHVCDARATLSEQARVLRPGGALVLSECNVLNPHAVYSCMIVNWVRSSKRGGAVKRGGIKWLLSRDIAFHERTLRAGVPVDVCWKDENIHSARYWVGLIKEIRAFCDIHGGTYWSKLAPKSVKVWGNKVWIEARKE